MHTNNTLITKLPRSDFERITPRNTTIVWYSDVYLHAMPEMLLFETIATCAVHVWPFMTRSRWAKPLGTFCLGFRLCMHPSPACFHQHNQSISCVWLACVTNCGEAYSQMVLYFATRNNMSQTHGPTIQCNGISTRRPGWTYCPSYIQSSETASWARSKWINEKSKTSHMWMTGLENVT